MGSGSSNLTSNSGSSASEDSTWFLAGDIEFWEKKHMMKGSSFGDTTIFMDGPEFTVRKVEDPPEPEQFIPNFTSSQLDIRGQKELREVLKPQPQQQQEPQKKKQELNSSYDRIPQPAEPSYAYLSSPVRGRARKRLPGWDCKKCEEYYVAAGLSKEIMSKCSKHRCKHPRSKSPNWFWDLTI